MSSPSKPPIRRGPSRPPMDRHDAGSPGAAAAEDHGKPQVSSRGGQSLLSRWNRPRGNRIRTAPIGCRMSVDRDTPTLGDVDTALRPCPVGCDSIGQTPLRSPRGGWIVRRSSDVGRLPADRRGRRAPAGPSCETQVAGPPNLPGTEPLGNRPRTRTPGAGNERAPVHHGEHRSDHPLRKDGQSPVSGDQSPTFVYLPPAGRLFPGERPPFTRRDLTTLSDHSALGDGIDLY